MSPALATYINSLDIRTYHMSNNLHIIGKLESETDQKISLKSALQIDTYFDDNENQCSVILPLVPASIDQISSLYRSHVTIENLAPIVLKKQYCDTLLSIKLSLEPFNNILSLETTNENGYNEGFGGRWKIKFSD